MVDVVAVLEARSPRQRSPRAISLQPGGGSAANVAALAGGAGTDVTLSAASATMRRRAVAPCGTSASTSCRRDPTAPTGTCIVLVEPGGERTMLPDPGANAALAPCDLPTTWTGTSCTSRAMGCSTGSRAAALAAIERARDAGMKISVDPASARAARQRPGLPARIAPIDLLLPNADEAAVLGRQIDVPSSS